MVIITGEHTKPEWKRNNECHLQRKRSQGIALQDDDEDDETR